MATNDAAIHLPQQSLTAASLSDLLRDMTRERCLQMAEQAYQQGRRDANDAIAGVLEELGK